MQRSWLQKLHHRSYRYLCLRCGTISPEATKVCATCRAPAYWATCQGHSVIDLPAGAQPCADCQLARPLSFRVTVRVLGQGLRAKQTLFVDYLCEDCNRRRIVKTLWANTLLGWWSLESLYKMPVAILKNWYAIWASPTSANTLRAYVTEDLAVQQQQAYFQLNTPQRPPGAGAGPPPPPRGPAGSSVPPPPSSGRAYAGSGASYGQNPVSEPATASAWNPLMRLTAGQRQQVMQAPANSQDYLLVDLDADSQQLQKAYRGALRKFHPDLHPGDAKAAQAMTELNLLWAVVQDDQLRAAYLWLQQNPEARA